MSSPSSSAPRVFVSHSHADNDYCRAFVNALRTAGCEVWYDEHNLGWGALRQVIERELQASQHFIVIVSPAAVASEWVNAEIDAALSLVSRGQLRSLLFVTAKRADVPLLLQRYKRIERPDGSGYMPTEAAARVLPIVHPVVPVHVTPPAPAVKVSVPAPRSRRHPAQATWWLPTARPRALALASIVALVLVIAVVTSVATLRAGRFPPFGPMATQSASTPRVLPSYLSAISMVSPSEGWAIGDGSLIHYANGAWLPQTPIPGVHLDGLYMLSSREGWAVGDAILHYSNGTWVRQSLPAAAAGVMLRGVAMVSSHEGWAVGDQQGIYHYLDGVWTQVKPVTVCDEFPTLAYYCGLVDVDGVQHNDVYSPLSVTTATNGTGWVVGGGGTLLRYDGHTWTQIVKSITPDTCYDAAGRSFSCAFPVPVTPTDLTSVVMLGQGEAWAVGNYVSYFPSGGDTTVFHYQGGRWQPVALSYQPLPNLQALAFDPNGDEGWAVGLGGVMLHYSGSRWTMVPSVTTHSLNGVYMLSATDGWAVGDGGTILRYTSGEWTVSHTNPAP